MVSIYAYHCAMIFLAIFVLSGWGQTLRGVCTCVCGYVQVHVCVCSDNPRRKANEPAVYYPLFIITATFRNSESWELMQYLLGLIAPP